MAMMKMFRAAAAAVVLVVAATPALAEQPNEDVKARAARRVDQAFAKLDTDKDGRISKVEAAKGDRIAKSFDKIDADHDGFVTRAELTAAVERRLARQARKKQTSPGPAPQPAPAPQQ